MKQIIVGIAVAVLLFGCGEKPKFSINLSDNVETYVNSPVFTKLDTVMDKGEAYKYTGAPQSINGIKTSDLDIYGGYVQLMSRDHLKGVNAYIKGKQNIMLIDRLKKSGYLKNYTCHDTSLVKGNEFMCKEDTTYDQLYITYNEFTNSTELLILTRF